MVGAFLAVALQASSNMPALHTPVHCAAVAGNNNLLRFQVSAQRNGVRVVSEGGAWPARSARGSWVEQANPGIVRYAVDSGSDRAILEMNASRTREGDVYLRVYEEGDPASSLPLAIGFCRDSRLTTSPAPPSGPAAAFSTLRAVGNAGDDVTCSVLTRDGRISRFRYTDTGPAATITPVAAGEWPGRTMNFTVGLMPAPVGPIAGTARPGKVLSNPGLSTMHLNFDPTRRVAAISFSFMFPLSEGAPAEIAFGHCGLLPARVQ